MRNEGRGVSRGTAKVLATHLALLAFVLAGPLIGCGKSSSSGGPGTRTLTSIAVDPPSLTVPTGARPQFAVIGSYSDSSTAPIASGITWSSSSPSVAEIDGSGLASCTGDSTRAGTTTITATVGALSAQASLVVTPSQLLSITVEPHSVELSVADTAAFSAVAHFADATTGTLRNATWSSSDRAVAEVDSSGFGRGVKKGGPVAITATDPGSGISDSAVVNVVDPRLQAITVSPGAGSIAVGFARQFTAIGQFSDGTNHVVPATWTSSGAAATVDDTGLALGVTAGQSVTITATSANGKSSTATLTVTDPVAPTPVAGNDSGTIDANAPTVYRVANLTPGTEYLVRVATPAPVGFDLRTLLYEVHQDASFTSRVCGSWASGTSPTRSGGPPCRAGAADVDGNLFVLLTGPAGTEFRFDVSPLPILTAGAPAVQGSVDDTETYYKLVGLTGLTFQPTLADSDLFADLFAYDRSQGPFGFDVVTDVGGSVVALGSPLPGALGSTVAASTVPKSFVGTTPANGVAYATIEGWLTASGTGFSVGVSSP